MISNWKVQWSGNNRESTLSVDAHAFVKSFNDIFSIGLRYNPRGCNNIILSVNSYIEFEYNDPCMMPEICEMLRYVNFVELHVDAVDNQSDKTELYDKAVIIISHQINDCSEKFIPRDFSVWMGEYDDRLKYMYKPGFDLSRVRSVSFVPGGGIPDDVENYQFYYVEVYDIVDIDKLLKINTEILRVDLDTFDSPDDWYRLLEKVKYFILYTDDALPVLQQWPACNQLLAYDINDKYDKHITLDELDEICKANRPRSSSLKSARNI